MIGFAEFGSHLDAVWAESSQSERTMIVMALRRRMVTVMTHSRSEETLSEGTTRPEVLHRRFEMWNQALAEIVRDPKVAIQRAQEVHRKLADASVCAICPNQLNGDDALWVSGGGLAHGYCARQQT
jgi:hypothetical protein